MAEEGLKVGPLARDRIARRGHPLLAAFGVGTFESFGPRGARAGVRSLRPRVGPSAIGRFIVPAGIDAVQLEARRTRPHVRKKDSEVLPLLTDRDPSGTVPLVTGRLRVSAASEHVAPRVVFGRPLARRRMPVRCPPRVASRHRAHPFNAQATATLCRPFPQIVASHRQSRAAVAVAQPSGLLAEAAGAAKNNQPPVTLASEVL